MEQVGFSSAEDRRLRISVFAGDGIHNVWPYVEEMLWKHKELWEVYYTMEYFQKFLMKGTMQAWTVTRGGEILILGLTQMDLYPSGLKVLNILELMGTDLVAEFDTMKNLFQQVEVFALKGGCTVIQSFARPGLEKLTREMGFKSPSRVIEKTLVTDERLN